MDDLTESSITVESVLTLLLPGLLLAVALLVIWRPNDAQLERMLSWIKEADFLSALLAFSAFGLLGAIIASVQEALETWVLDAITPRRIGVARQEYNDHWFKYVDSLPANSNPYISRLVTFLQYETRLALAGMVLAWAVLHQFSIAYGIVLFALSLGLYWMGMSHHKELAILRQKAAGRQP
jgi:hypothetical protein